MHIDGKNPKQGHYIVFWGGDLILLVKLAAEIVAMSEILTQLEIIKIGYLIGL